MAHEDAGLWCEIVRADCGGRAALFLDRDGVIVEDTQFLGCAAAMRIMARAVAAIARCNALGLPVVVVTNQSGIARGYYDWNGFHAVQASLCGALAAGGAHLDAVLACAYHQDGNAPLRVANHPWRKPNPGMILTAAARMNLNLSRSWMIGDRASDLAAGAAAGLAGGTLLGRDEEERRQASCLANARFVAEISANLDEAVAGLIESGRLLGRAHS